MKSITKEILLKSRDNELSDSSANTDVIDEIITMVKQNGDAALRRYSELFDNVQLNTIKLSSSEIQRQADTVSDELKQDIDIAYENIYAYHNLQKPNNYELETSKGVRCEMRYRPIKSIGVYIPGGSAVLFSSLLMTAIPSLIAGNTNRIMCTPPSEDGSISPYLAYTAMKCKIEEIYLVGGAQAIAAMAYGTESIPKVDKIFGPGNKYVTLAKQIVSNRTRVSIDMPAGPSEVLIIADDKANPEILASDLLSQLEHGEDSRAVLLCTNADVIAKTEIALQEQTKTLSRQNVINESMKQCVSVLINSVDEGIQISNAYAPEHLIVSTQSYAEDIDSITCAGSIFLSEYSAESFGDYASGTNHTLPTMGLANAYSGVTVADFYLSQMIQEVTKTGLQTLGPTVKRLAEAEELDAHAAAISKRLQILGDPS